MMSPCLHGIQSTQRVSPSRVAYRREREAQLPLHLTDPSICPIEIQLAGWRWITRKPQSVPLTTTTKRKRWFSGAWIIFLTPAVVQAAHEGLWGQSLLLDGVPYADLQVVLQYADQQCMVLRMRQADTVIVPTMPTPLINNGKAPASAAISRLSI